MFVAYTIIYIIDLLLKHFSVILFMWRRFERLFNTKRTYIYKQYHENNILSLLKTLQCNLIHVTTLILKRLSNKIAKLALAISNVWHKHKSHFLVPQICGCAFIAINQSIVWFSPFSFNFHMWLESSVLFWRDLCLNNDVLLLYVSLKLFSEAP